MMGKMSIDFRILTLHKTFLCRIPRLRKSPETREAETRGGKEQQMTRIRGQRREVAPPLPETRIPARGRKTEVQRVNPLRNLTPKSPPPPQSRVPRQN